MNNKEIVVYGGCFNPPLNSHFGLAEQLLNEYENIEKVLFVPVNDDYRNSSFYDKELIISAEDRYNMLKLVCDKNDKLDVSRVEIDEGKQLNTYETLEKIQGLYPESKIAFLMGSDNLKSLEKWGNAEELVNKFHIYILERDKDNVEEIIDNSDFLRNHRGNLTKAKENIVSNISSTYVRKKLVENKTIRYLVPDEIYLYLQESRGLFADKATNETDSATELAEKTTKGGVPLLDIEIDGVVNWIREYVDGAGVKGVVIGDSGGKDSAVCIALATKALGKERVYAVSMPCHSIESDGDDAKLVADTFGVNFMKVDLTETYDHMEKEINEKMEGELSREAKINIKPRLRMTTLYGIAQSLGCLVIGTGNMCEIAVGYTTKWGDSASDFNPLAEFTVDEVLEIGRILGIPDKIVNKAPNDGLGGQTDEEKMGVKYCQIADMIKSGTTDDEEAMAKIQRMFNNSRHKRRMVTTYKLKTVDRDFSKLENAE